jgi:hypothetical protein
MAVLVPADGSAWVPDAAARRAVTAAARQHGFTHAALELPGE